MALPRKLRGAILCAGIGGDHALGNYVRPALYCEVEPFCQAVLLSRMADGSLPRAPIWDDLTTLDGTAMRGAIDIVVAGFPCQDLSVAGRRAGLDGERSSLYRHVLRFVAETRPLFVYLENVSGIRRHANRVIGELADLGYDARWAHVSASDVGAPHIRERWWCLAADADQIRLRIESERREQHAPECRDAVLVDDGSERLAASDASGAGCEGRGRARAARRNTRAYDRSVAAAHAARERRGEGRAKREGFVGHATSVGRGVALADADEIRRDERRKLQEGQSQAGQGRVVADADRDGREQWGGAR